MRKFLELRVLLLGSGLNHFLEIFVAGRLLAQKSHRCILLPRSANLFDRGLIIQQNLSDLLCVVAVLNLIRIEGPILIHQFYKCVPSICAPNTCLIGLQEPSKLTDGLDQGVQSRVVQFSQRVVGLEVLSINEKFEG